MEQISDLTLLVFRTSFGRTHMWCLSGAAAASQFNLATCTMWWWWSGAGGEEEVWDFGSQQGKSPSGGFISVASSSCRGNFLQSPRNKQLVCHCVIPLWVFSVVIWIFAIFSGVERAAAEKFLHFV